MGLFENGIGDIWWRIDVVKFKKLFQSFLFLSRTNEKAENLSPPRKIDAPPLSLKLSIMG